MYRIIVATLMSYLLFFSSLGFAENLPIQKNPIDFYELQEVGMTFRHGDENSKPYYEVITDNGVADTIKEGDLKGYLTFLKPGKATVDLYMPFEGKTWVSRYYFTIVPKGTFDPDCTIVFNYVNSTRNEQGLQLLEFSTELNAICAVRAKELARNYSHTRPDGSLFVSAVANKGTSLSENICVTTKPSGEMELPEYFHAWDSWNKNPESRGNMLHPAVREMGMNYYYDPVSQKRFWVQIFRG